MRSLIVVALSLSVLAVAGCSGSDDADPTTTSGTAAPATTPAPPDTETASTTDAATSTTSAPATTEAPTTTLDPTAALIADIEGDLNAGEQALFAAGADPSNPALRADVTQHFADDALTRVTEYLDQLAADGLLARENPEVPTVVKVREVMPSDDDAVKTVLMCRIDSTVVYEQLGDQEAIVNDLIVRTVTSVPVVLSAGIWRVEGGGDQLERAEGATTCE